MYKRTKLSAFVSIQSCHTGNAVYLNSELLHVLFLRIFSNIALKQMEINSKHKIRDTCKFT
jgi:hypothetical protein